MEQKINSNLIVNGIVALPASWDIKNPLGVSRLIEKPEIVDYESFASCSDRLDKVKIVSIMKFSDGTETKCMCDVEDDDDYVAFLTCYGKKLLGDDFKKTIKYWTETKVINDARQAIKESEEKEARIKAEEVKRAARERKRYRRMVRQKELELRAELEAHKNVMGDQL